jgi:hypothetical protein
MSLLLAPVGAFTSSSFAIRTYLALLAGLCLYLAFRPWLSIFAERWPYTHLPAIAAGLFGPLWVTVLYGMKSSRTCGWHWRS